MKKLLILTALTMFVGSAIGCGIIDRWCERRGARYQPCPPVTYGAPVYGDCGTCAPPAGALPGPESYAPGTGGQ